MFFCQREVKLYGAWRLSVFFKIGSLSISQHADIYMQSKLYPRLIQDVQLVIKELENVTILWEELWLSTLQDLHTGNSFDLLIECKCFMIIYMTQLFHNVEEISYLEGNTAYSCPIVCHSCIFKPHKKHSCSSYFKFFCTEFKDIFCRQEENLKILYI